MPSRKVADLPPGLVAIKGSAAPMSGVESRSAPGTAKEAKPAGERETGLPLNFRVSAELRRAFKTYAARHDLKLNELFRLSFEAYRSQRGD